MTRCPEVHPHTKRQCRLEAGHLEQGEPHRPEEYTETEAERLATRCSRDLKDLIHRWIEGEVPVACVITTLGGGFASSARHSGLPDAETLEVFLKMMGRAEPSDDRLSKEDMLRRVAAMLDCPVEDVTD